MEDLDFTLLEGAKLDDVLREFEAAFQETHRACGMKVFISRTEEKGVNSHTFYIGYEGPDYNIELTMLVPEIEKKLAFRKKTIEAVRGTFEHKQLR